MIVFRGKALEEPTSIFVIMGGVQITLAFVMFLIGALLPKDGRYVTGKAKIILKIILVLAALGNNSPGSLAAYDLADGKVKVQRFWEPALPLTWLFTEAAFLAFFPSSGILAVAVFGSGAVLVLLFIGSLGWKILELKEKHIYRMLYVILPSLIITGIFVLIFLITFIQQWLRGPKLSEQLAETRAEIEETLDSYGEGTDADVPVAVFHTGRYATSDESYANIPKNDSPSIFSIQNFVIGKYAFCSFRLSNGGDVYEQVWDLSTSELVSNRYSKDSRSFFDINVSGKPVQFDWWHTVNGEIFCLLGYSEAVRFFPDMKEDDNPVILHLRYTGPELQPSGNPDGPLSGE